MRLCLPFLLSIFALCACAPLKIYYRAGVPVTQLTADTTQCEVRALADVPVALERIEEPPEFVPPRERCDSAGNCTHEPGYWEPGHVYTVDVNKKLRKRVEAQCMAGRGYAPVSVPQCPAGIKAEGRTQVLPNLTGTSCAIRSKDGFLIVDRS